jgi:hypothetical protein
MKKYEQKLPCLTVALKLLNFEARDKSFAAFFDWVYFLGCKRRNFSGVVPKAIRRGNPELKRKIQSAQLAWQKAPTIFNKSSLHSYTISLYIYASAAPSGAALISFAPNCVNAG